MKRYSLLVLTLAAIPALVCADQTDSNTGKGAQASASPSYERWLVRVRALDLQPNTSSRAFSALGLNFADNSVGVSNKWFPELDLSYFFTPNIAAELILTYPQQHDVNLAGVGALGTITHLPPTLSVQYHYPIPNSPFIPYVGVGLNYTTITSQSLSASGSALTVTQNSVGPAFGVGLDYNINSHWVANIDYKYVYLQTNVKVAASEAILTDLHINPNLFSIGIGYRF